ncbi:PH domain-containing protein [Candidatus Peregrinibacteria bacterium]|nr:PH domain-containing protein [Candidatus Peregrinibacteria bacterium]
MYIDFPDKRPDEEILMVITKHPVVYFKIILAFALTVILPLALFWLFWLYSHAADGFYKTNLVLGIFSCIYVLYGFIYVAIRWLDEQFDIFIITSERLIDITQVSLFRRTVAATPLEQIQDTTVDIHGVIPTLFNYGDIKVKTAAGTASDFFIDRVSDPNIAAKNILAWARERENKIRGNPSEPS